MLFEPKKDWKAYCDESGAFTPNGLRRIRRESNTFFAELAELRPSVTAGVCVYKGKINEKLQERSPEAYRDILGFLGEPTYAKTASYDEDLTCFYHTAAIYRMEEGSVEKTIYDCIEYTEDFLEIYSKVWFLFCRILRGLPSDDCMEELEKQGVSVFVLQQLLQEMTLLHKDSIAVFLAAYYRSLGRGKEADYLRKATEAQL
ncbi:MAG: hypothetical protein K6E50_00855 [Lachnospiraceae bacterium]|nr:hypothetical protein [Lachnospiraceae bacterium]